MQTFRILIGQDSRKGVFQQLHEVFVNSDHDEHEISKHFSKLYRGFVVDAKKINEFLIVKKPKEILGAEEKSSVVEEEGMCSVRYNAYLASRDIEEWKNWIDPLNTAKEEALRLEIEIRKNVEKKFGISGLYDFKIFQDGVRFSFTPSSFDFPIVAKKRDSKDSDLPF